METPATSPTESLPQTRIRSHADVAMNLVNSGRFEDAIKNLNGSGLFFPRSSCLVPECLVPECLWRCLFSSHVSVPLQNLRGAAVFRRSDSLIITYAIACLS